MSRLKKKKSNQALCKEPGELENRHFCLVLINDT